MKNTILENEKELKNLFEASLGYLVIEEKHKKNFESNLIDLKFSLQLFLFCKRGGHSMNHI